MDTAVAVSSSASARTWGGELRATLALAWPLILANLTMQLIQATDVVLLGWLLMREPVGLRKQGSDISGGDHGRRPRGLDDVLRLLREGRDIARLRRRA